MPTPRSPRFLFLSTVLFLLASIGVAAGQHEGGVTGGGMIGGSTSRPSRPPASAATKP